MKVSKEILQAVLIGITIQGTLVSCSKDNSSIDIRDNEKKQVTDTTQGNGDSTVYHYDNCPACGMG